LALFTDDADSPPSLEVILVVLPVFSDEDNVIARPSFTEAAEVPPVARSAVVLPDLSPLVGFASSPLLICANVGLILMYKKSYQDTV